MRALSLLLIALTIGCSESHASEDAASPHDALADDCPPIGAPRCVDANCCVEEAAAVLEPGCHYACPSGFVVADACDPSATCAFDAPCSRPSECTLAIDTCCGPCGTPALDDYDAILATASAAHMASVCPMPDPICPDCAVMVNPSLGATCNEGRCEAFDVRQLPLSACTTDDACRIRTRDCCECGGAIDPGSLIAVRGDARAEYQLLVCDDLACPECAPSYPTDLEAYCADDGHCASRCVP